MMNISSGVEEVDDDVLKYKIAVGNNWKKDDEFSKLVKDYLQIIRSSPINDELLNAVKARVMEVLKGHPDLIWGFNTFVSKEHPITPTLQLETNGKKVKVEENCELPWDVLHIISKTLDFDDQFEFGGVCKNWRVFHKIYWRNFLELQEPLLLQDSYFPGNRSYSFISIPNKKVYCLKTMNYFSKYKYSNCYCYGGYFIMLNINNSCLLINQFTKVKKEINIPTFEDWSYRTKILLAFGKCSEEFVLVVSFFCSMNLHVYQSRNFSWVTYSTTKIIGKVVDFVVLHNMIYVVTSKANIGVLNLNSASIKFLKLKSTPNFNFECKLVNYDEELLVVDFMLCELKVVYKIDFSTMSYVKLDTLGDLALFYAFNGHCYALKNPNMWGYKSNSVYVVSHSHLECCEYSRDEICQKYIVLPTSAETGTFMYNWCCAYSGNDSKSQEYVILRAPLNLGGRSSNYDWCFRHLRYEVDYSLIE